MPAGFRIEWKGRASLRKHASSINTTYKLFSTASPKRRKDLLNPGALSTSAICSRFLNTIGKLPESLVNGCWLRIQVEIDGKRFSEKESALKFKKLVEHIASQTNNRSVGQVVFYAPNPKRAITYLVLLHFVFDNCEKIYS